MNCFKCNNKIPMNIGWSAHLNSHNKKCEFEYFVHSNILGGICYIDIELGFSYCIFKANLLNNFNIINIANPINKPISLNYNIEPIIDDKEAYDFLIKSINRHKNNLIFE